MDSIENIKEALVKACAYSQPRYFKPFLLSDKVVTEWPDKESFYEFFRYILSATKKMSEGELHLKIKCPNLDNKKLLHYEFYDKVHIHSRITIVVEEYDEAIHLNILPF